MARGKEASLEGAVDKLVPRAQQDAVSHSQLSTLVKQVCVRLVSE